MPRFRGPLTIVQRRCPDGRETSPLRAGVPAPDGVRVALVRAGRTPGELAREFECSAHAVRNWVRQADRDEGRREDGLTSAEREELCRLRRENRQLREEREILKKAAARVRSGDRHGAREVFELVRASRAEHRMATMCRVPGVSPSGYHAWVGRGRSRHARRDEELRGEVQAIHVRSRGTYGAPRVHAELADQGHAVGRKRVARLMPEQGLAGVSRRRGTRTTRPDPGRRRAAPDLVERRFQAQAPNRLWVADITYVPTWAGFVFLAVVLDVFSRRIVGWAMADHLRTELVLEALNMAVGQRRPEAVIHHSDSE